jgi:signal transduction histidine kinase
MRRHGHWGHGWHRGDEPPPWWPEGETWPPPSDRNHFGGPRWHRRRRLRRRILFTILGFWLLFWLVGMVVGRTFDRSWSDERRDDDRNPIGLVAFTGAVLLIGSAGAYVAYRRLSRPVGALLDAADQVSEGDFDVDVEPGGPRELRALAQAFNEMAGRLSDTTEQRRRFLADVSHELRTPLAVLQSGLEAQLDGIHARDDQHLSSLLEETRRLGLLVDDLHTLALADAGQLALHRERVEVAGLVDDALAAHRPVAQRREVELQRTATVTRQVDVDPVRIRQVLDNLLSNAVRHTPRGGAVEVTVADEPDAVRVTVADAGAGFPPDQVGHLFERFTRSHDSSGSGLGLSIARDLVEAHGGTIEAHNRPESGAAVSFTLPAVR